MRKRSTILLLTVFLLAGIASSLHAEGVTASAGYPADGWLESRAPVEIKLSRTLVPEDGRPAVLIGSSDMTALFELSGDTLTYPGGAVPLASGEKETIVYLVSSEGQWTEIGRFPIRVLNRIGFAQTTFTPTADLTGKGQVDERHFPDDNAPARTDFQDGTMQLALRGEAISPAFTLRAEGQVMGVTFRNEALRFGTEGENAPPIDLASYRFELQRGNTLFAIGHVGYGAMRHLINGFTSRGASVTFGQNQPISLQLAAMSGSSIVGWDNASGLQEADHRMLSATLGFELIRSRPGALRLETSYLDGSLLPQNGFNQGAIHIAETSKGTAVRLLATDAKQRFRIEAGYSSSRFKEAFDQQVEEGLEVTPIASKRRDAIYADSSLAIIPNRQLNEKTSTSLTLNLRHEEIQPLFRSVGAGVQPDLRNSGGDLIWTIGSVTTQLQHNLTRDNLFGIETILTTRSERSALTVSAPLAAIFARQGKQSPWLPTLSLQFDHTHQHADLVPPNSGFTENDLPDQISDNGQASTDWQLANGMRFGFRLGRTETDSRQVGREASDFETATHALTYGFSHGSGFLWNIDLSLDQNKSLEQQRTDTIRRIGTNLSWTVFGLTTVSGGVSHSFGYDSLDVGEQETTDGFFELSTGIKFSRRPEERRQARVFVRYSDQTANQNDRIFGIDSNRELRTVTTGLSATVF